jgi:hypothetical protein
MRTKNFWSKKSDAKTKHDFKLPQNIVYSVTSNMGGSNNMGNVHANAKTFFKQFQLNIALNY